MELRHAPEVTFHPQKLSNLAEIGPLQLLGSDQEVTALHPLNLAEKDSEPVLTYCLNEKYLRALMDVSLTAIPVIPASLAQQVPANRTALLSNANPEIAFFEIYAHLVRSGQYWRLPARLGNDVFVANSAVIHDNVQLGDGCVIMDHVVLLPNTHLGKGVVIKPNSTIGGNGFYVKRIGGIRQVLPQAGGVWLEDYVEIGSGSAIDRGTFTFTFIDRESKVDNLVYIAHDVRIDPECTLTGSTQIGGYVTLGKGVWMGPNSATIQLISIGEYSYVGVGAAICKSIPAYSKVLGNPARFVAFVCKCRTKLEAVSETGYICPSCGLRFRMVEHRLQAEEDSH